MAFDPEKFSYLEVVQHLLASQCGDGKRKIQFFYGVRVAVVDGYKVVLNRVLWDSGALHSSYVSQQRLDRHRKELVNKIRSEVAVVRLGDSVTRINLKEKVTLEVETVSPVSSSEKTIATIDFYVMSMPGMDGIVGLPDILDHILDNFIDILESGRCRRVNVEDSFHLTKLEGLEKRYGDLEVPWKVQMEELLTEEPFLFSGPLYYLSKPYEEVVLENF